MDKVQLPLEIRTSKTGKSITGFESVAPVSGVIYGQGKPAISVFAPRNVIDKIFSEAGSNHVIEAEVEGKSYNVMLQDTQLDPMTNSIQHFDLLEIRMDQKIEADIPVKIIDEPENLDDEVVLATLLDVIKVEALPAELPEAFEVSVEGLKEVGDSIKVGDIASKSSSKVTILTELDEIIAKLDHKAVEEEEPEETDEESTEEGSDGDSESQDSGDDTADESNADEPEVKEE